MFKSQEVCKILGISKTTLFRYEKTNKILSPSRLSSGSRLYSLEDIKLIALSLTARQKLTAKHSIQKLIGEKFNEVSTLITLLSVM